MTSKKRKSSLPGSTAKRQKPNTCESHPVTPKRRRDVPSKAKTTLGSAQNRKPPKAPANNKAIKNSNSSKTEVEKKSTGLKATKKSGVKIVPAKGKSQRLAKEVTSLKKSTQKSSNSASKAQRTSQSNVSKTVAKESSVKNKSDRITRSACKSPVSKATKSVKKSVSTSTRQKSNFQPVGVKKTVNNANHGTPSKSAQKKGKESNMRQKCNPQNQKVTNTKKQTVHSVKKQQAPVRNASVKKPKGKAQKPAKAVQKATGTQRVIKPSQPTPAVSKKIEEKTKQRNTKTIPEKNKLRAKEKIQKAEAKSKTCSKKVKKSGPVNSTKKSKSVPNSSVEKEITVGKVSVSCSSSNQMLDLSVSGKLPDKGKVEANIRSSSAPLKCKRTNLKPKDSTTKNKAKKQKVVHFEADKKDTPSKDDQKSKRVSILDLCNEIAGEIESDTVEVLKAPSTPPSPTQEKIEDVKAQSPADVSPPSAEKSPVNQMKRFFPSRRPSQLKCKLEKKNSPGTKNSKWNKIKLKNSFAQNNVLRQRAILPSLEMIKAKIPQGRQLAPGVPVLMNSKKADTASATQSKQTKPTLVQKVKGNETLIPGSGVVLGKASAENGLLENHVKHELEAALDEVINASYLFIYHFKWCKRPDVFFSLNFFQIQF